MVESHISKLIMLSILFLSSSGRLSHRVVAKNAASGGEMIWSSCHTGGTSIILPLLRKSCSSFVIIDLGFFVVGGAHLP